MRRSDSRPVVVVYEYHQITAGQVFYQENIEELRSLGYSVYLDEEAAGTDLTKKMSLVTDALEALKNQRESDHTSWQLRVLEQRINTLHYLNSSSATYVAIDLPFQPIVNYVKEHSEWFLKHPDGTHRALEVVLSGEDSQRMELFHARDKHMAEAIVSQKRVSHEGVSTIIGCRHAPGLQRFFKEHAPEVDTLSYFVYAAAPHDEYEKNARDPEKSEQYFPGGVERIHFDNSRCDKKRIITDVLAYDELMTNFYAEKPRLGKGVDDKEEALAILNIMARLLLLCDKLDAFNNRDLYKLCVLSYIGKVSLCLGDAERAKQSYLTGRSLFKNLPSSALKTEAKENFLQTHQSLKTK